MRLLFKADFVVLKLAVRKNRKRFLIEKIFICASKISQKVSGGFKVARKTKNFVNFRLTSFVNGPT